MLLSFSVSLVFLSTEVFWRVDTKFCKGIIIAQSSKIQTLVIDDSDF